VWTHADGTVVSNSFIPTPTNNLTFHFINQTRAADGTTRQFGRDGSGNLTNYVDALTNVWRYQYGAGGLLTNAINPTGGVTRFTYTPSRDLTNRLDAATNFTRWSRDVFHRVVVVSNADGSRTFFQFDANDNLTNILTPRTNAYGFGYDANNRIETSVDPLGRAFTNRWDHMDRLADQYDAQGNPVHVDFDPLGRVRRVRDPNQIEISVSYDKALRVASWTNEIGVAWRIEYDAEGVPKMVIDPIGRTNVTHTDTMGRPTNIVYAMTNDLGFRYDGLGRVTQLKDELGLRNHRHHDAAGNLTNNLLADGFLGSRYEFDSLHRPTNAVDPRGNAHASRWDSMGRRISDTDPLGRVTVYEYDRQNRISRIVFPGGLGSQTNTYDAEGNPVRGLFSDGTDLQFGWDAAGRLASANGLALAYSPIDRITNCNGLAMTYDAGGRMTSLTFAPGRTLTYAYDPRGLVTNIGDWAVGNVRFGYDTVGRLVSIERPNGITTTNQYDAMNRLVFIQDGSLAAGVLTRDAAGRILSNNFTRPLQAPLFGLSLTNSYDAANQIAGAQYDALGRVTNDGSRVYRWDLAGRLSQLVQGTQTNVYTYDALRQRLTRTAGGMSRSYVWNYAFPAPVLSVERESGNDLRYFIHLPDGSLVYSVETNNARRFYHYDETGSTLFLTDDSGNIVRAYDYDAFGRPLAASGTVENAFTWQGRNGVMQEGTNALYYQRARYYEAERGRWLSPDLVRARGPRGLNTYQYGWNNPLNFVDRTGRDPEPVDDFAREKKSIAELRERMEAAADPADRKRFAELLKDQMRALEEATSQRPLAAVTPEQLAEQARRVSELHARMVSARDPRERRLQTVIFQEQAALLATYVRIYEPASPSKASRREALLREKEHLDDMIRDASGDARGHAADARARATATDFVQAIFDFGSSYANRQARHESKARDYRQDVDHLTRQRAHVEAALGQLETTGNPSVLQYTETSEPEGATP
jgi:RHS repeat-associated protein